MCGQSASRGEKKSDSSYSQVDDADNVGKLFAGNSGSIPVSQRERLREILRGRAFTRVIQIVP
jgi:hypothetical protein